MDIEILQSRAYRVIGLKHEGETCHAPEWIARQLIAQGFAREARGGKAAQAKTASTAADEPGKGEAAED